jgi:hypothetical protein
VAERIQTPADERSWFSGGHGVALLWIGLLAAPVAWALDLLSSYAAVKWTCSSQHTSALHLITLGALLITAGGAAASWTAFQRTPEPSSEDGPRPVDRGKFMAMLGLLSSAMFALAMIANAVPRVLLDACL